MSLNIKFNGIKVTELKISSDYKIEADTDELATTFIVAPGFAKEDDHVFIIVFDLTLENKETKFFLKVKSHAQFETTEPIKEDFINSNFVKINAPAIAFPYLRAFVSTLTLNAGYRPIVLPTFNFIRMAEEDFPKEKVEVLLDNE